MHIALYIFGGIFYLVRFRPIAFLIFFNVIKFTVYKLFLILCFLLNVFVYIMFRQYSTTLRTQKFAKQNFANKPTLLKLSNYILSRRNITIN